MTYPKHLYRADGPYKAKGFAYSIAGCVDDVAEKELLASGWHLTIDAAKPRGEVIKTADVEVDLTSPPTRAEMMQMAKELGLKGAHLMKDDTLAARIKAAV